MNITDILAPDMILPSLQAASKTEILEELALPVCTKYPQVKLNELVEVLVQRERLGSTAIGDGIAIPHGKVAGISKIVGVFGRSLKGVDFESLDGKPTYLFFLLVAPEDSTSLHLKALARVSRLLKSASFREQLMNAPSSAEIFRLLKEEDSRF